MPALNADLAVAVCVPLCVPFHNQCPVQMIDQSFQRRLPAQNTAPDLPRGRCGAGQGSEQDLLRWSLGRFLCAF